MKNKHILTLILFTGLIVSCSNWFKPIEIALFKVNFDYGFCNKRVDQETGEETGAITTLFNSSFLEFDIPKPEKMLIPGDTLTVNYTGQIIVQETYPGRTFLSGGKVTLALYTYIDVIDISSNMIKIDGKLNRIDGFSYRDEYVIIDKDLNYIPLKDFEGDELFASFDNIVYSDSNSTGEKYAEALFAFNPRA